MVFLLTFGWVLSAYLYPINILLMRLNLLVSILFLVIVWFWMQKRRTWLIVLSAVGILGCVGIFFLPKQSYSLADFWTAYVSNLEKYRGVRYVWGGENMI